MDYILVIGLTLVTSFAIIRVITKYRGHPSRIVYRQSDVHNLVKNIIEKETRYMSKPSQLEQRIQNNAVKVVFTDDKAYWVSDNTFYVADTVENTIVSESAKPVDTQDMSKNEIDKMLFILDNLDRGRENDSGGTGN